MYLRWNRTLPLQRLPIYCSGSILFVNGYIVRDWNVLLTHILSVFIEHWRNYFKNHLCNEYYSSFLYLQFILINLLP